MSKDSEKGKYTTPDGEATREYICTACCALLVFCNGCVPAWTSPSLDKLMGPESPIPTTAEQGSTLAAMIAFGFMLAPIATMLIVDRIGRRNSLMVGTIPLIVSWGLTIVATDVTVLIASRFLGGFSFGLTMSIVPMYLGEIASARLRGALGMICSTMVNTGTVFMFVVVPYVSIRVTAIICLSIIAASAVTIWFIPESPYFLAMRGRFEEAEISLEKLRGKTDVTEELNLVKETLRQNDKVSAGGENENKETTSALKLLFTTPANRRSLLINLLFSVSLSWGSCITIASYCILIYKAMEAPISANVSMVLTGVLQFLSNLLTTFIVEKCRRKRLLFISGVTSGICLLIVAIYFYLLEYTDMNVTQYSMIALCAVFVNLCAVNVGVMPLQMVIQSETIATEVKALTSSLVTVMGGFLTTLNLKAYILIAVTLDYGNAIPFFGFAIITLFSIFFILKLLPETKGRTFLEIQNSLRS